MELRITRPRPTSRRRSSFGRPCLMLALVVSLAFGSLSAGLGQGGGDAAYEAPNWDHPLFDAEEVRVRDGSKERLLDALTGAACLDGLSPEIKARALGVALDLDSLYKPAFAANFALKLGREPAYTGSYREAAVIARELLEVGQTPEAVAGEQAETLRVLLVDLALQIDPGNVEAAYASAVHRKAGKLADWSREERQEVPSDATVAAARGSAGAGMAAGLVTPGRAGESAEALLRVRQAQVKGLLVREVGASRFAGKASQMNATAIPQPGSDALSIGFNQGVGPSMESALHEVMKFLQLRHGGFPGGYAVELGFQEQYVPKDGPSAAVACALLINELLTGVGLDPDFAVTGDMNADGTVQPVGGIDGKVRGAAKLDCEIVAVPAANANVISDLYIIEGVGAVSAIQIFRIGHFDEALALALPPAKRPENLRTAIERFGEVQEVLARPNGANYLSHPKVQEKLAECVRLAPDHLSARLLQLHGQGRGPRHLTLTGSLQTIDRSAEPLMRALRQGNFESSSSLDSDGFGDAYFALQRVRSKLDSRTWKCADAIITYSSLMRQMVQNRPNSRNAFNKLAAQIREAGEQVSREYDNLHSRVDVQEELMR